MSPIALPPPTPTWSTISLKAFSLDYALISTPESIKGKNIKLPPQLNFNKNTFATVNFFEKQLNPSVIIHKSYSSKDYLVEPPVIYPLFPVW